MDRFKFLIIIVMIGTSIITAHAQEGGQLKIAVLDLKAGTGVTHQDADGFSNVLTTYLLDKKKFQITERLEVEKQVKAMNFQKTDISTSQIVEIGKMLGVKKILAGGVSFGMNQHKIELRIIDIEKGIVSSTTDITIAQGTDYREPLKTLADNVTQKLKNANISSRIPAQTLNTGDEFGGGMVVYEKDGHGIIVNLKDLGGLVSWSEAMNISNNLDEGGKTDWELPSKDALNELYKNLRTLNERLKNLPEANGFTGVFAYWSSSEDAHGFNAWQQTFPWGWQFDNGKKGKGKVRCVRTF